MKPGKRIVGLAIAAALSTVSIVKASDPVGVYGIVERVVFEPREAESTKDAAPKNVQVFGAFTAAVQPETRSYKPEEAYGPVGRGYLYYTCAPAQASACAAEWSDLKSVAGKGEVVGFGTRWGKVKPRLRPAGEAPSSPDLYETNVGVVKMGKYAEYPSLVAALKAAIGRK